MEEEREKEEEKYGVGHHSLDLISDCVPSGGEQAGDRNTIRLGSRAGRYDDTLLS